MRRVGRVVLGLLLAAVAVEGLGRLALARRDVRDRLERSGEVGRMLGGVYRARAIAEARDGEATVGHTRLRDHPTLGWTTAPGAHAMPYGPCTIDGLGRRVTGPEGTLPAPGARRIALVGDSFTFGDEVPDPETWAWRVREATGAAVEDWGVLGFGLGQVVLRTEADVLPRHPDVVVLGISSMVLLRTGLRWDVWAKPRFALRGGALELEGPPFPDAGTLAAQLPRSALVWIGWLWAERLRGGIADWTRLEPVNTALLRRLRAQVEAAGAVLVPVYLAVEDEYGQPGGGGHEAHRQFEAWCASGVLDGCVDTLPALTRAYAQGVEVSSGAHWSAAGNAVVAEVVAGALGGG